MWPLPAGRACRHVGFSLPLAGMRELQQRVWRRRGEQHLLIKLSRASGEWQALMFVALDELNN